MIDFENFHVSREAYIRAQELPRIPGVPYPEHALDVASRILLMEDEDVLNLDPMHDAVSVLGIIFQVSGEAEDPAEYFAISKGLMMHPELKEEYMALLKLRRQTTKAGILAVDSACSGIDIRVNVNPRRKR